MVASSALDTGGHAKPVALKKEIGILKGLGIVIGMIIGSGIFVSPVGVLKYTRSVGLSLVVWVIAGLISALGAIVYVELGVTIQKSGGEYIYVFHTFHSFFAFIVVWIMFIVMGTIGSTINALVFAQYLLRPFYSTCDVPKPAIQAVAALALLTICFVNCYRVSWATRLAVVFMICKIAALTLVVGFGCYYLARGSVSSFVDPFEDSATSPSALANALYQGFWAYAGWNCLNFLTGEMKNPARNLPIVIILSLFIVTSVYLLTNVAYLAVLSPFEVLDLGERSTAIAVEFASRCVHFLTWLMPVFVGASVFGTLNSDVLATSRICFTASENGHMPTILSMVNVTNCTPIPAVLCRVILAIILQLYDDIFALIGITGFAFTVASTLAVSSLLHIRRTNPDLNTTGFRLPIFLHVTYLVINICIGIFSIYDSPRSAALSLGLIGLGIPVYLLGVVWKKPRAVELALYKTTILLQKVFNVVQQEPISQGFEPEWETHSESRLRYKKRDSVAS